MLLSHQLLVSKTDSLGFISDIEFPMSNQNLNEDLDGILSPKL